MQRDLEEAYIPSCTDCMHNKLSTRNKPGPLHPLPILDGQCESVAINFIGPLLEEEGHNSIITMACHLGSDFQFTRQTNMTAEELAVKYFDSWYCENGLPLELVCNRDKLFISCFWKALTKLTGVKIKMSTAYHPQSDGSSEHTNKTINQALRYHIK